MPRNLRFVPSPTKMFAFTYRAREGRLAFVPEDQLTQEWVGILDEAHQRYSGVQLHQAMLLSNHVTGMISVRGPNPVNQLALWQAYVFGQTALVSQAVHGLKGEVWESRRCRFVPLHDEESVRESAGHPDLRRRGPGLRARRRPGR